MRCVLTKFLPLAVIFVGLVLLILAGTVATRNNDETGQAGRRATTGSNIPGLDSRPGQQPSETIGVGGSRR